MIERSAKLTEILHTTLDGEWGKSDPAPDHEVCRVIRGGDFPQVAKGDLSRVPKRFVEHRRLRRKHLQDGDILIETAGGSRDRPTGRTVLVKESLLKKAEIPITCASFARFMRVNTEAAYPPFVYWYLQNLYKQGEMWKYQVQHTGVARFQFTEFSNRIDIPLLSHSDQRAISSILGALDDKIDLNLRMNETLESAARTLYKSWFVDFDPIVARAAGKRPFGMDEATAALFPDRFVESESGPIPEEWRIVDVYDIAQVIYGAAFSSKLFDTEGRGRPLIRIRDLPSDSPGVFTTEVHRKEHSVEAGDILVGMDGAFVPYLWKGATALLNQRVCKLKPKAPVPTAYVVNAIREKLEEEERSQVGTTVIHLGKRDIDRFRFLCPSTSILRVFGKTSDPMIHLMVSNGIQNRTLAQLRDLLLPELVSGEIRVKDAEKAVQEVL